MLLPKASRITSSPSVVLSQGAPLTRLTVLTGVYTLVSTLNGAPSTQSAVTVGTPATQAANAAGGTAPPGGQAQANEQQPPPPAYPSKAAIVAVTLPVKEAGSGGQGLAGLGMGMSIGSRRTKEAAADTTTSSATTTTTNGDSQGADRDGNGLLGPQSGNASGAIPIGGGSGNSPASKRKPLTSSFSMLGGLSLAAAAAAGDSSGVTTSRPARTFKGSTSSFIRSWEGLPVSQVMLRTIGEANAGHQTIFGFQILGKVLLWHEIGMGKRVSCDGGLAVFVVCPRVLIPFIIAGLSEPNRFCLFSDMHRREPTYSFGDADRRADRLRHRRHSLDGRVSLLYSPSASHVR